MERRTEHPLESDPVHVTTLASLGWTSVEACLAFEGGEVVKATLPGRDVVHVPGRLGAAGHYLKRVRGRGRREPRHEYAVLQRLHERGLSVPEPVAAGASPDGGVLVTAGLPGRSLEELLLDGSLAPARGRLLASRVAALLRALHDAGVNHRDLYAGHLIVGEHDVVHLVDLARAEVRDRVPRRRIVKDLAALSSSIPERCAGTRARLRFLLAYLGRPVDRAYARRLARTVARKAARMRRHGLRQVARGAPNIHVNA